MNSSSTVANGIGQPVRRKEDLRLLTGRGSFADDVSLPELAHAVIVRSPMPMRILHPSTKEQRLGRLVCSRCSPAATMWRMGSGRSPTAVGSWPTRCGGSASRPQADHNPRLPDAAR
jgi:hypothetical protein